MRQQGSSPVTGSPSQGLQLLNPRNTASRVKATDPSNVEFQPWPQEGRFMTGKTLVARWPRPLPRYLISTHRVFHHRGSSAKTRGRIHVKNEVRADGNQS